MEPTQTREWSSLDVRSAEIRRVVETCLRRREEGEVLSDDQLVTEHPELLPELEEELKALALIQRARRQAGELTEILDSRSAASQADQGLCPPPDFFPGYELLGEIHRGGQGIVYKAIQHSTRRTVAIKVLLEGPFADDRARFRFEREVKLVAGLKHPNIVVVHDSGITLGRYYYAMDYVSGLPVDAYVRARGLGVRDILRLFECICDAVSYAQRHGVIHRDLKPSNILVSEEGVPCVLDFGLAKATSDRMRQTLDDVVTQSGHLVGTLHYMSPEQTSGAPESIDVRTDVYSLGVILYELLTGSFPYDTHQDITNVIRCIREVDPPRPSRTRRDQSLRAINSELDAIVLRALEKEPARRYQSAGELHQDICAWLEGRPVTAKSASSLYLIRKIAFRHSFEALVLLTLVISFGAFATIATQAVIGERAAEAELQRSEAEFVDHTKRSSQGQTRLTQQMSFGWFLADWQAGRTERAKQIRDRLAEGTPERAAMTFLLDETYPLERLRDDHGTPFAFLTDYVLGERLAGRGEMAEACAAFSTSAREAATAGDRWWADTARARSAQLCGTAETEDTIGPSG